MFLLLCIISRQAHTESVRTHFHKIGFSQSSTSPIPCVCLLNTLANLIMLLVINKNIMLSAQLSFFDFAITRLVIAYLFFYISAHLTQINKSGCDPNLNFKNMKLYNTFHLILQWRPCPIWVHLFNRIVIVSISVGTFIMLSANYTPLKIIRWTLR